MVQPIRPEDILADGQESVSFGEVSARKGTVAAFVANAKLLGGLDQGAPERSAILGQLQELVPGLRAVGVLDVFEARSPEIAARIESS